jgi:putative peptidoglycan lipid II flippase
LSAPFYRRDSRALLAPALTVTGLTVVAQVIAFGTRAVTAAFIGVGAEMDAYLAVIAVPQYVLSLLVSSLGSVMPAVFVQYAAREREREAWSVVATVLSLSASAVAIATICGLLFPASLVRLSAPGLPESTLRLAVDLAPLVWPTVLLLVVASLLGGIHQTRGRFGWAAALPVLGGGANLAVMVVAAPSMGVWALAVGGISAACVQAIGFLALTRADGRLRVALDLSHPGLREIVRLVAPLLVAGLLLKATPLIERGLASSLPEGSITRLDYALKLVAVASLLISTSVSTVLGRVFAWAAAERDLEKARQNLSLSLRMSWLAVVPTIFVGAVLAEPLIGVVFERGRFGPDDTRAVAQLLRVYLLALSGMCIGAVTANAFYMLGDTRTPSTIGVLETIAYALYTIALARWLGAEGIALGYVCYFTGSLIWMLPVLRRRVGNTGGWSIARSCLRSTVAAAGAAGAAAVVAGAVDPPLGKLLCGGAVALLSYGLLLHVSRSPELRALWSTARRSSSLVRS